MIFLFGKGKNYPYSAFQGGQKNVTATNKHKMKQKLTFISALVFTILLVSAVSCQNSHDRKGKKGQTVLADTAVFNPGVVYDSVNCFRYPVNHMHSICQRITAPRINFR